MTKKGPAKLRRSSLDHATHDTFPFATQRTRLSFAEVEAAYLRDALVFHGINKKTSETFKKWHAFVPADPKSTNVDAATVAKLDAFARRVNLRRHVMHAYADALLYGDAYTEVVFDPDSAPAELPPARGPSQGIADLVLVNPSTMTRVRDGKVGSSSFGDVTHFAQKVAGQANRIIKLNPERIRHLRLHRIGDEERGVGVVEAAYNVLLGKVKADRKLGEILVWDATGFDILNIKDATDEELTEGYATMQKARENGLNFFVGSDRHVFSKASPANVNPDPILRAFYTAIAAVLDMPTDMLVGVSAGAVTGSEVNLRDYYESCQALLDAHFTPYLESLYATELGVAVEDLPVRVKWHPLYVNEQSAADVRFKNAQAGDVAYRNGAITLNEYRTQFLGLDAIANGDKLATPVSDMPAFDDGPPAREDPPDNE